MRSDRLSDCQTRADHASSFAANAANATEKKRPATAGNNGGFTAEILMVFFGDT